MNAPVPSRRRRRIAAALLVTAGLVAGGASRAAPDAGSPPVPACIRVSSEARYVPFGWSHVVVLTSSCTKEAACSVSTDVNPEKQNVVVPKGQTVEVVTFLSSPSQAFVAQVGCTLR